MPWSSFFECWVLGHFFFTLFHLLQEALQFLFAFCLKGGVICVSEVLAISPCNLDCSLCFIQPSISHDVLCTEVKAAHGLDFFSNFEPVCCFMSSSTVASCPAYRFLRRQVRWSGISISLRIAVTTWTFVGNLMSLLFNTLSRFVTAYLPNSKQCFWMKTFGNIFEQKDYFLAISFLCINFFHVEFSSLHFEKNFNSMRHFPFSKTNFMNGLNQGLWRIIWRLVLWMHKRGSDWK